MAQNNKESLTPTALLSLLTNLPPGSKLELEILPSGAVAVSEDTPKTKEQLIEEKYAPLKGVGITISEAVKRYGVPDGAIRGWIYSSRDVNFVNETVYPKLVDEAEVALCADIYKERKKTGTAGLRYFDLDGYLITTVKRPAASRRLKQAA